MTPERIAQIKARLEAEVPDVELAALVSEVVFGVPLGSPRYYAGPLFDQMDEAWRIVEKMQEFGWCVAMGVVHADTLDYDWECWCHFNRTTGQSPSVEARTMPRAICLGALAVLVNS